MTTAAQHDDGAKPAGPNDAPAAPVASRQWPRFVRERVLPLLAPLVAAGVIARTAIHEIVARLGHPGATLDDAYIHFQYARAIAEGHPLRFQAGEPITSGATSLLWPVLLAPFYSVGFTDEAILWPAWVLSFGALGLLAYETFHLTKRLTGAAVAAGAAAMVLCFSGFTWCAASGMEVVPFAWSLARAARRSSEWAEMPAHERSRARTWELVAIAWAASLFRPEGALLALFVAVTLVTFPAKPTLRARSLGLLALSGALVTPLLLLVTTGTATSNTTLVKLLVGNPYYPGLVLWTTVGNNVRFLIGSLLNGEEHAWEFLPVDGAPVALAGLVAIPLAGWRAKANWRALSVLLIALLMFAPCFYDTFLWNRLRYVWPFATGWLIGVACLARMVTMVPEVLSSMVIGKTILEALKSRGFVRGPVWTVPRWVAPLACGLIAGTLGAKLSGHYWNRQGVMKDIGDNAAGIDKQQVALGRWANANLPADARIGVNDTGAIAYFSDRHTFDIVGLTTEGEARYWVAGAGSRFEHYEDLYRTTPYKLPTHFIVYPEWMACDAVLGAPLHEATVTGDERSILGGDTMRVYAADYTLLGTGEQPWTKMGPIADALDVADLESEASHRYELLGAHANTQIARVGWSPDGEQVADGGRTDRTAERFVVKLPRGRPVRGVVRLEAYATDSARAGGSIAVLANGKHVDTIGIYGGASWQELAFALPAATTAETTLELTTVGLSLTVYHYWFDEGGARE